MSGKKGRSGRRKLPTTILEEAINRNDGRIADMFDALFDLATGARVAVLDKSGEVVDAYTRLPDRDACQYLIDRRMGRPRIEIDNRRTLEIHISPQELEEYLRKVREESQRLLERSPQQADQGGDSMEEGPQQLLLEQGISTSQWQDWQI